MEAFPPVNMLTLVSAAQGVESHRKAGITTQTFRLVAMATQRGIFVDGVKTEIEKKLPHAAEPKVSRAKALQVPIFTTVQGRQRRCFRFFYFFIRRQLSQARRKLFSIMKLFLSRGKFTVLAISSA